MRRAVLAMLFFFHPAANTIIGKAYFSGSGLNRMFDQAIGFNVLLQPAIVLSILFIALTPSAHRLRAQSVRGGLSVGLALWLAGAVFATLWNPGGELVMMTFFSVFVSGTFVYIALSNYAPDDGDVDVIFIALAAGALLPLWSGLAAFYGDWGAPNISTVVAAHASATGIQAYEEATFGSRGNTASLLVLIGPPLVALAFDRQRSWWSRGLYGVCTALVIVNLIILQQRTVIVIYIASLAFIWRFRSKTGSVYLIYAVGAALGLYLASTYVPGVAELVEDRFLPAVTLDAEGDASVEQREEAIRIGIQIAAAHPLGLGPGSAMVVHPDGSAHQLNVQQALECGVLGLLGSLVLVISAPLLLVRSVSRKAREPEDVRRFLFILGPACYFIHGAVSNVAVNFGFVNSWAVLMVAMIALMPPFRRRAVRAVGWSAATWRARSGGLPLLVAARPEVAQS